MAKVGAMLMSIQNEQALGTLSFKEGMGVPGMHASCRKRPQSAAVSGHNSWADLQHVINVTNTMYIYCTSFIGCSGLF